MTQIARASIDGSAPLPSLDAGTPGDDLFLGTAAGDFIYVRKTGADTVRGRDGNDFIDVRWQDGGDLLDGGDGSDTLILNYRGVEFDIVIDLTDPDRVQTLADGTRIVRIERLDFKGGSGDDTIIGSASDFLDGGAGDDVLEGPAASMSGGAGNDVLRRYDEDFDNLDDMSGGAGNDTLYGSNGDEFLRGDGGADLILAGGGDDQISGGKGRDTIDAGAGDDIVIVGAGDGIDILDGGEGHDDLFLDRSESTVAFDFTFDGSGAAVRLADGTRFTNFEFLEFRGGSGDDRVASAGPLYGGGGNDTLTALGDGPNIVDGGDGDDVITGSAGRDTLYGGEGDDHITTSADGDTVRGGAGDDTIVGGDGGDEIDAGYGLDIVTAGGGNDTVFAHDVFLEYDGVDTLDGGAGRDTLNYFFAFDSVTVNLRTGTDSSGSTLLNFENVTGGRSADRLIGDDGANVLYGGEGSDTLNGGGGADRFVFGREVYAPDVFGQIDAPDHVRDFSGAEGDRIDLSRMDAIRGGGNDAFTFIGSDAFSGEAGELRAVSRNGVFVVSGDRDGDGKADFSIRIVSDAPLTADDFML